MFFRLFCLFTLVPALEIYILIRVGTFIGALNTILLIALTGIMGAYYARQQGFRILMDIQLRMQTGDLPGDELINGALLLVGGALLLTPGFLTDMLGFALIFPVTRERIKAAVKSSLKKRIEAGEITIYGP